MPATIARYWMLIQCERSFGNLLYWRIVYNISSWGPESIPTILFDQNTVIMLRCHVNRPSLHALLVACLCLCAYLQPAAQAVPLQGKEISISFKKSNLTNILYEISKKSGITIYFVNEDISVYKDITYEAKNQLVTSILADLLKGRGLQFEVISEKHITVHKSAKKEGVSFAPRDTLSVSGKVMDENGHPIPGATVLVKGTKLGTVTNETGFFSLKNVPSSGVLSISGVSFLSKEIFVKSRTNVGITELSRLVKNLDETVVLAYTKTTNRFLTGNVGGIKAKAIENSPVNNPILAVAGRVPGVTINQASGLSGGGVDIVIQGYNSLQNGSAPFYVIDGVPYTQALLPNLGNILRTSGRGAGDGPTTGNPLSYINPTDIERIEVLKDADATAIYGSRAANGAIIITTKRGKAGTLKVDVNLQTGIAQVARKLDLLSTQEYLMMRKEAKSNDGAMIGPSDYDLNGAWDSTMTNDWQKELVGNNAKYTHLQFGLSGGSSNIQYLFATSYHKETTVFPTDLADIKASVKLNLDGSSKDGNFKFSLSNSYLTDNNRLPNNDLTQAAMILPPNNPKLRNDDGSLNWGTNSAGISTITQHPYASLSSLYLNKTRNLISNASLSYKIIKGLEIKTNFGYTSLRTDEVSTFPLSTRPPERRPTGTRTANYGDNEITSWIIEPQVSFNQKIYLGDLNILVGGSFQQTNSIRELVSGRGYASDQVLENMSAATTLTSTMTILSNYKYNAAFMQFNYNWDQKYIFNLSGRRDGSSRFGSSNRFHNFAAVGAAWIFSSEPFIRDNISFLSFGKVKFSYGLTGNDQIGDYRFLSLYQSNNPDIPYRGPALGLVAISNPYLQWEETRKRSMGIDIGIASNRIIFSANYYRNISSNMLVTAPLPALAGPAGSLVANLPAKIENYGWELSATSTNIKSANASWTTDVNLTIPRNKLKSFDDLTSSVYAYDYVIGSASNIVKTYHATGVNPETGVYEFLDREGKVTNDPSSDPLNYNQLIDPNPKYYGGINNTINFKGFSFDILFQFVNQIGRNAPFSGAPGFTKNNHQRFVLDRWRMEGDVEPVQKYTTDNSDVLNAYDNNYLSDAYWTSASFIRLKNLALAYYLPDKILSKVWMKSCKIYFSAQNLLTITSYKGLDPETQSNFSLPPLRVLTLGVQASF